MPTSTIRIKSRKDRAAKTAKKIEHSILTIPTLRALRRPSLPALRFFDAIFAAFDGTARIAKKIEASPVIVDQ